MAASETKRGARYVLNPAGHCANRSDGLFSQEDRARVSAYFNARDEYAPTPLRRLPGFAAELGIDEVSIKDESARLGLPAIKILGMSYALDV
jgi:diaminopropionate ammonia-lyase